MIKCLACGYLNVDLDTNCERCGRPLSAEEPIRMDAPRRPAHVSAPYTVTAFCDGPVTRLSNLPAINELKRTGASGWFLALCLFWTLRFLALGAALLLPLNVAGLHLFANASFAAKTGVTQSLDFWMNSGLPNYTLQLPQMALSLLYLIGFWLIFAACSNSRRSSCRTGGFATVYAAGLIHLIGAALYALVPIALVILPFTTAMKNNAFHSTYIRLGVRYYYAVAVLAAAAVLLLLFTIGILSLAASARNTALTGMKARPRLLVYVALMAPLCSAAILGGTTAVYLWVSPVPAIFAEPALQLFFSICLSVVLLRWRRSIRRA